jgi:hypothetical protein
MGRGTVTAACVTPCLRDVLAEALWHARTWHSHPEFSDEAKAALYEGLHDAVVTAPDDTAALELVRAAVSAGTAEAGDLPGITSGGDAGTEDESKSMTGVGK